jgi:membrane protease YdiL (CAAX protease family)
VYEHAAEADPPPLTEPMLGPVAIEPARFPAPTRSTALVEVILCSGYPTQLLLLALLTSLGMNVRTASGALDPTFVFTLSLLDALLLISLILFLIRSGGERVGDVLLGSRRVSREAVVGLALIPVVFLAVILLLGLLLTIAPGLHNVPRNPLEAMVQTPRDAIIFSIVVMVAGGVREEVQRGFIIHRFDRHLGGAALGVAAYSVAFGLGHIEQGWDAAVATGLLGTIWGVIYLLRRSIVAPMVSHAGFNLLQLLKFLSLR